MTYTQQVTRLIRLLLFVQVVAVLGWGFSTIPQFFAGLTMGTAIGMLNAIYSAYKIHTVGEAVVNQTGRKPTLGMVTRLSLAALGAIVCLRFPGHFDVNGYVVGLLSMPVLALGDAIYTQLKPGKARERGE
ncbi:ATP synthase subunit I [Caldalkalibacillus salinus]|uniref:ATP synthase subunit I n=1 Tax=Caldalkalibacillus salinus TaxID=2803787 RepID=UPI0019210BB5|nr:ATP synthase subunit I [Caldalkalibacillus salinus]